MELFKRDGKNRLVSDSGFLGFDIADLRNFKI